MPNQQTKKDRLQAIALVIFLFIFAGSILTTISVNNKTTNSNLYKQVLSRRAYLLNTENLNSLTLKAIPPESISARSFLVLAVTADGQRKILGEKLSDSTLPIASITKLMTAIIVLQNIPLQTQIIAKPDYVGGEGSAMVIEAGHTYTAENLLRNMLTASDNDAAKVLSSYIGEINFIKLMNTQAENLGLTHTHFVNVTGLDPIPGEDQTDVNISNTLDLAQILLFIQKDYPLILSNTKYVTYNFCDIINRCKVVTSTNLLLPDKDLKFKIIGGKTGRTDLAGSNLALMTKVDENLNLISIVLGSTNNFADTRTILNNIIVNK